MNSGHQSHQSDPRVLNRRTLERDHRRLAEVLRPGMAVLDVGCGTGAITAGIARAVGPEGQVVGIDRDTALLAIARQEFQALGNLRFQNGDALSLPFENAFDVVTAARALQWISRPDLAIRQMRRAAKAGGQIMALDYNHEDNAWEPTAPFEFLRFYRACLDWRTANHWTNQMGVRLPDLFDAAGIGEIRMHLSDETVERGHSDFSAAATIWSHVIETIGPQIVASGFLSEPERLSAACSYGDYVQNGLNRQTLCMRTVEGTKSIT